MLKRFRTNTSGNFAILLALLLVPLVLAIGFAVDGARFYSARNHIQNGADALSLALASSSEQDAAQLRKMADGFLQSNVSAAIIEQPSISLFKADSEQVEVVIDGTVPTTFMKMAGYTQIKVQASSLAMRAPTRNVEVALVLDNTYSMSEVINGVSRLDTLKKASKDLIGELLPDDAEDTNISVGIIPYADYVNVGTKYKAKSWISLTEAERSVPANAGICTTEKKTVNDKCLEYGPYYDCSTNTDGIITTKSCHSCTKYSTKESNVETCTGKTAAKDYKWFGCVASRIAGVSRLSDENPATPFPGLVDTSQKCFDPLLPLTKTKKDLLAAITAMKYENGSSYRPLTYIPGGLIWGVNVLSPPEPLNEGGEYDEDNVDPRKILILMTDGDNTLKFNKTTGKHDTITTDVTKSTERSKDVQATNADTLAICTYAKKKNMEIYTVAFMVENELAQTLLENCATDKAHFYDATNSAKLLTAFSGIARSINQVRLAR